MAANFGLPSTFPATQPRATARPTRIRLMIASVDKAKELGMDWRAHNPAFTPGAGSESEDGAKELSKRVEQLETAVVAR
jgi:hypothetical protein